MTRPQILGVTQAAGSDRLYIQLSGDATAAGARALGHEFELELTGGPLISGPLPSGKFEYVPVRGVIEPDTPTTALVSFPDWSKPTDREAFLLANHLRILHWFHADNGFVIVRVKLPPANLYPQLVDPYYGKFRVALPMGLTIASVVEWAKQSAMTLISYMPDTGTAIVHPNSWRPPAVQPLRVYPRAKARPPARASGSLLYVQFESNLASSGISSIAQGLGLGVVSVAPANLAVFSVDPSRVKAEIQLLSDIASVQCVSTASNACALTRGAPAATSATPTMQSFAQPVTLAAVVRDGVLELSWSAASGATAYAIYQASAAAGPFDLVAVVAGQQRTRLPLFELVPAGAAAYFEVLALQPCADGSASAACDSISPAVFGGGPTVAWTNSTPVAAPSPDPNASPSETTSVAPAQTAVGTAPLAAPANVAATAVDGHVTLSWDAVPGSAAYRVYRSAAGGPSLYIAGTSGLAFTDAGGTVGVVYEYRVSAVDSEGLVGKASSAAEVTWVAATSAPRVLRSLPAEASPLAGAVRFEVDAQSGSGRGRVEWDLSGPAAALTIGTASGRPDASLGWSAALIWDSASVPDGTYTVSATVTDAAGPQVTTTSKYRIQNGAPMGPIGLSGISVAGGVALAWQQPATDAGATYRVYRDQAVSGTPLAELSGDRRSFLDGRVTGGPHVYQLVLVDAAGHASSAASATVTYSPVSAPAPAAPLDLRLVLPNGQPLAVGGRAADRLLVTTAAAEGLQLELSGDGTSWRVLGDQFVCGDVCAADLDLRPFAPGPYMLRLATPTRTGSPRSFVRAEAVRYSAPIGLTLVTGPLGVTLGWAAPASAIPSSYRVERRDAGGGWRLLQEVSSTSYIDISPPRGAAVSYRVIAVDLEGVDGEPSDDASVTLPVAEWAQDAVLASPVAPAALEVLAGQGRAALRWHGVAGSAGYVVERQSEAGGPFARVAVIAATSFTDEPVLGAGRYTYRVEALNGPVAGPASAEASALLVPEVAPPPIPQSGTTPSSAPPVPSTVKATARPGELDLTWSAPAGTPSFTTYSVYRVSPSTAVFTRAASGLTTTSFVDAALAPGASYGYVVTSSTPNGFESAFSSPVWSAVPSSAGLDVRILAPVGAQVATDPAADLVSIAEVTAAAGLAGVSFAISAGDGLWKTLPTSPQDPHSPSFPAPSTVAGAGALWTSTVNTQSLAPGAYQLRVQARDRAGRTQQSVQSLVIADAGARGPPAIPVTSTPTPGDVHLAWSASPSIFTIQRSLFGPEGPFETIATTESTSYDDRLAIPGLNYSYRVVSGPATSAGTASATAATSNAADGPALDLGGVNASELSVRSSATELPQALPSGITAGTIPFEIDAVSLASGDEVHRLGEQAVISFAVPPGLATADSSSIAIFHWDSASASWVREVSSAGAAPALVSATVDHLSVFVVGVASPPAAGGGAAQQPAPPSDFRGGTGSPDTVGPDGELLTMRDANSRTYLNGDGTLRTVVGAGMVNFKDASGTWQKIDTTLTPSTTGAGYLRNAAGPLAISLPSDLGTSPVRVTTSAGAADFSLVGASSSARQVSADSASYDEVWRGVNVIYQMVPEGLKENLVIKQRIAGRPQFSFDLHTGALSLERMPDGSIRAVDPRGNPQFSISPPWMHDAATVQSPEGTASSDIEVTLTGGEGSYRLTYTPSAAWLNDPARLYPVVIDPSLTYSYAYGGEQDDQINNCSPDYNYHTFTYLPIGATPYNMGTYWCYSPSRAVIIFTIPLTGTVISSATLQLYQYVNTNGGGSPIYAEAATEGWGWTTVTWHSPHTGGPYQTCLYGCQSKNTLNGTGWIQWDVTQTVQAWQTGETPNYGWSMIGNENGCVPACNEEFFASDNYGTGGLRPQLVLNWNDESGTIAWQNNTPQVVTAVAGSLLSIPLTVTNTANAINGTLTWHAFNHTDLVRLGIRDYVQSTGGNSGIPNGPNFRTYLPNDVGPGQSANVVAYMQAPTDPGDYLLNVDLVHETPTSTIWFADRGNKPLVVRARILAPGDDTTTHVPVVLGDGTSLAVNTSNGFSTLAATDISIPERGGATLRIGRNYNAVNGLLSSTDTASTSATYGLGWTYDFQRSVHLGSLSPGAYDLNTAGILTDAQGRANLVTWNQSRGVYEVGSMTLTPTLAQVTSATGTLSVPALTPVDLINGGAIAADGTAPGGYALTIERGTSPPVAPPMLIMPAGVIPARQNGTIEFWFRPNFDMSAANAGCHVFFADAQLRFGLAWNCPTSSYSWGSPTAGAFDFFTYDTAYHTLSTAAITSWGSVNDPIPNHWHHISLTWADGGALQLLTDNTPAAGTPVTTHAQASIADVFWGYQPNANGTTLNYLNGRIAQLRIDGRVVGSTELTNDAATGATLSGNINTTYLGRYDGGTAASAYGNYVLQNPDQSTETYSSYGVLQSEADRFGNQIDYLWDASGPSGRITSIADHFIANRAINFTYNANGFVATDFGARTVTYTVSPTTHDLVSVTKSNVVPDPKTGVLNTQNPPPSTGYAYASGHLLRQITDPGAGITTVNYDQSYRQVVLVDKPTAYWRLDESSGTTALDSVGGYNATYSGAVLGQGGALWNDLDTAAKFNGSAYAQRANNAALNPSTFTVEAWARVNGSPAGPNGFSIVSTAYRGASGTSGYELEVTPGSTWSLLAGNGSSTYTSIAGGNVVLGQWTHLAATFAAGVLTFYVNGNVKGTASTAYVPNTDPTCFLTIAGDEYASAPACNSQPPAWLLNGVVDELAVYPTVLSAARIQAHFVAGRLGVSASPTGYAANVVFDSPAAYWRLGESYSARAFDQSGAGDNGTYLGGVSLGKGGSLLDDPNPAPAFDGASGYVSVADNPTLFGGGQLTAEAWIRASSWNSGSILNRRTTGNVGGFTLEATATGQIQMFAYVSGVWYNAVTPTGLSTGVWHHVAGTYDGSYIRVYVDGQFVVQTAITGVANNPAGPVFLIGKNAAGSSYFNGQIDDAAYYTFALSAQRIAAHYAAARPAALVNNGAYRANVMADMPSAYWRLDEPTGSANARDQTANHYDGQYNNVTLAQPGGVGTDPDQAATFNGTSSYVGNINLTLTNAITVESWIYTTNAGQSGFIVGKNPVNTNWELFIAGNVLYWRTGGKGCGATSPYGWTDLTAPAPTANAWHQLVATQNGSVAQLYVDGQVVASRTDQASIGTNAGTVEIGRYAQSTGPIGVNNTTCPANYYFNGSIDDVAVYPVALSSTRVLAHYQSAQLAALAATGTTQGSYRETVGTDRPVGFWRLDETSGPTAQDQSGYNNSGTYGGGFTLAQGAGPLATESSVAAAFDGTTGNVSIPTSPSLTVSAMTVEAWFYPRSTNIAPIVEYNDGTTLGVHLWNWPNPDTIWVNFVDTAGNSHGIQSPGGQIAVNHWYHVVATYDGSVGSLYINGVLVGRASFGSFTPRTGYQLNIAHRPSGSPQYYLSGLVSNVAIYPYALPASRVAAHYNSGFDFTQERVASIQDARGNAVDRFNYNDDLATTQVIDGRGLASYYTFQQFGGRTMSITDSGNNVTTYEYDGSAAYRLTAVVSPTGVRHSRVMNTGGPPGQQDQVLMEDDAAQPSMTHQALMAGGYPGASAYGAYTPYTDGESWIWDSTVELQPGVASHRSTPSGAWHQHYLTFANAVLIPAGAKLEQWLYIEPGTAPPLQIILQFEAANLNGNNDATGWGHREMWGANNRRYDLGTSCPAMCWVSTSLPPEGRWVLLTINLGPGEVDMAGRYLNGIAFSLEGGGGAVYWGPTTLDFPAPAGADPVRAVKTYAYNAMNDVVAAVDANGVATVTDFDGFGLARQIAKGIASGPTLISEDTLSYASGTAPWAIEYGNSGWGTYGSGTQSTVKYNGGNTLYLSQNYAGLKSDLYFDRTGLLPGQFIRVSVWAMTSGGSGLGGALLAVESQFLGSTRRSAPIQSPTWVQLSVPVIADSSGRIRIHLDQESFAGTTYWADLRIDDITPVPDITMQPTARQSGWMLSTASGVTATWSNLAWGGVGNGPSRKVSVTSATTNAADVADVLTNSLLRNGATYVISVWASASVPGTTVDFSLRDANGNLLTMDNATTCAIGTSPTLCQNSLTYTGLDYAANQLTIRYGGFGPRDVYISHPLIALSSELHDYTPFGQPTRTFDIFGHETRTDYDSQSLYPVQTTTKVVADGAPAVLQPLSYPSQVLADAPQGYWRLGETSGTSAADLSGHNNTGTISSTGVTLGMQGALPADPNRSMAFNGSNGDVSVNLPGLDLVAGHNVTVDFWMYWRGPNATWQMPFSFATTCLCFSSTGMFGFNTQANDIWGIDGRPLANRWVHVTAVFNNGPGTQSQLYINGVKQTLTQLMGTTGSTQVSQAALIAGPSGMGFSGQLDDVAVYNGALTATRVAAHYMVARPQNVSAAGSQANYSSNLLADQPVGYWRFGETSQAVAADSSGNGMYGSEYGGFVDGQTGPFAGDPNTAVSLNGSNAYIQTYNMAALFPSLTITIELWFKANGPGVLVDELGQTALNGSTWHASLLELVQSGTVLNVMARVWNLPAPYLTVGSVTTGTWHHVVLRYDGSTSILVGFLDGVRSAPATIARQKPAAAYYTFGSTDSTNMGSGAYFNGSIDEAAIYATALPDARVQAHYQARYAGWTPQPTFNSAQLGDQPLGLWRLDEPAGLTATDSSRNGNNGVISGTVTYGVAGAQATDADTGMKFDGSSGAVTFTTSNTPNNALSKIDTTAGHQITVEFWMNWNGSSASEMPVSFGPNTYDLWLDPTRGFGFNSGNSDILGVPIAAIPANTWIHVVGVFTNNAMYPNQLYLNGARQALTQWGSPVTRSVSATMYIGGYTGGGYRFAGNLDDFALYNRALTQSAVLAHYLAGRSRASSNPYPTTVLADGPVGYWRLDEGSGTSAADSSGFGQTGTYTTGVTYGAQGALTYDADTAVSLDGTNGYIGTPAYNLRAFSAEVWWDGTVNTATGANGWAGPMQMRQSGLYGFQFVNNAANLSVFTPHLVIWNGSSEVAQFMSTVSYNLPFGGMKHFVWTYDGSTARLFVNGAEVTVTTSPTTGFATSCTCIGLGYARVAGRVDEAALYTYPLTPARILAHYQAATLPAPFQYTVPVGPAPPALTGLITQIQNNSLGQEISTTRVSGATQITLKHELDSWGRVTADIQNYVSSGPVDQQTNVRTGRVYDLNGNLTDTYTEYGDPSVQTLSWVDAHIDYDARGNVVDQIANYTGGTEDATSNVTTRFVYDAANERTDEISPAATAGGSVTTHRVYDAAGHVVQLIANYAPTLPADAQTNVTTTTYYDAAGRVVTVWNPLGSGQVPTMNTYDAIGRLIRQVAGTTTPPSGFLSAVSEVDTAYDLGGRTLDVVGPVIGNPAVAGLPGAPPAPAAHDTRYDYDALGRKLSVTVAIDLGPSSAATTTYVYDPRGAALTYSPSVAPSQTPAIGSVATRIDLDLAGHPLDQINNWVRGGPSNADTNVKSSVAYDGFGRPNVKTDPVGVVTQVVYDALDRPISVTLDPTGLNLTTQYDYSYAGDRVRVKTPRDVNSPRVDQTVYDQLHRSVATYQNCAACLTTGTEDTQTNIKSQTSYDSVNRVLKTTDWIVQVNGQAATARVSQFDYDHVGRKVDQIVDCVPIDCSQPQAATITDQNLKTSWTVDASGLVLSETSPRTCNVTFPCNQGGPMLSDGSSIVTAYAYDDLGHLWKVFDDSTHLNLITTYAYDAAGDLISMTDPTTIRTQTTQYGIDPFGRTTMVVDPIGNIVTTSYSPAGVVTSVKNGRGFTNGYVVDHLGRVLTENYQKGNLALVSNMFSYDAAGHRVTFANSDVAATTVTYDAAGRVAGVGAPGGGAPSCVTIPLGVAQTCYFYFKDGSVSSITDVTDTSTQRSTAFTEDPLGRLATTKDPLQAPAVSTYSFDSLGRLTSRVEASGITTQIPTIGGYSGIDQLLLKQEIVSGTVYDSWANAYDAGGNRTQETTTLSGDIIACPTVSPCTGAAFQFDTFDRLSSATQPTQAALTYNYDKASNRNAVSGGTAPRGNTAFSYQANNALASETFGTTTVNYVPDADGNMTQDAGGHFLTYDSLNRLDGVYADVAHTVPLETFTYDALGRLVSCSTYASSTTPDCTGTNGAATESFAYQGLSNQVIQVSIGASPVQKYAWDTRGRVLAVQVVGTGTYTLFTDPHGDIVALAYVSGTQISIAGWRHYDPWGQVPAGWSGGTQIPFGFQGDFTDSLTGFVLMGARWYDPREGRFVSEDPAAVRADLRTPIDRDMWLYGNDNPIRYSDPTGLYLMCDGCRCGDDACLNRYEQEQQAAAQAPPPASPKGPDDRPTTTTCDQACQEAYLAQLEKQRQQQAAAAAHQKKCDWWDVGCKAKQAWDATTKAVSDAWNFCKSSDLCKTAVTIGVGVAVYAGCTALTAGAGALACGVVAGAVSGAVSGAMDCKAGESMGGCVASGAAIGAVTGLVGGVAGKAVELVGGRIVSAVVSRLGSRVEAGAESALKDAADDVGATCTRNSFSAGTLVLMADGTEKPIEQIRIGDRVMAGDPVSGLDVPEPVAYVIVGHGLKHLYDIHVDGEVIEATYNHPFWVVELQAFVWAEDLVPGEHLLLADGRAPPIAAISHHDEITTVYNLSITDIHTYFVGTHSILVHNCGPELPGGGGKDAPRVNVGGETKAAARGRDIHETFDKGLREAGQSDPKVQPGLRSGPNRPDGFYDSDPIELKPNTPSGIAAGRAQLNRYMPAFGAQRGYLFTYDDEGFISLHSIFEL